MLLFCQSIGHTETLTASWYSVASLKKEGTWKKCEKRMANGKRFNENALTCATRLYPLGTLLRVTRIIKGETEEDDITKVVIVKVTDRIGKRFAKTRIDLTKIAFEYLLTENETTDIGLLKVKVEKVNNIIDEIF
jgi:rare lipoprotein A (peptidoglycan hydrolase)